MGMNLSKRFILTNPECLCCTADARQHPHSLIVAGVVLHGKCRWTLGRPQTPSATQRLQAKLVQRAELPVRGNNPSGAGCCGIVRPGEKLFCTDICWGWFTGFVSGRLTPWETANTDRVTWAESKSYNQSGWKRLPWSLSSLTEYLSL